MNRSSLSLRLFASLCLLLLGGASALQPPLSPASRRAFDATSKASLLTTPVVPSDTAASAPLRLAVANSLTAAAASAAAFFPIAALAEEASDYEYGAVNAPIGIAVGAGILAILTAALPVLLRGGEEAFEEIRERDAGTFGSRNNKDVLGKRK